jgi:hypothetical protein
VLFAIVVGIGNGIYEEIRVTGRSKEALFNFVRALQAGGFEHGTDACVIGRQLYREGDACFPAERPFVFLSPIIGVGEQIDFNELESEIQECAAELEKEKEVPPHKLSAMRMQPLFEVNEEGKRWWKFW